MTIHRIFCWLTALWRNIVDFNGIAPWGGCTFVDQEVIPHAEVTISKCEVCGKVDVAWQRLASKSISPSDEQGEKV